MADSDVGGNPYQQLVKRLLITLLLGVVVYRFGVWVPVPGINVDALQERITGSGDGGAVDAVLRWANMFNGGAIAQGSVFGLGIMPYISASIIIQLMAFSFPALKQLQKEGEVGRRKLNQYTRYVTLGICLVQSVLAAGAVAKMQGGYFLLPEFKDNAAMFVVQAMLVVTCGSMVLLWLAEQITKHGVGNGVSVIIMIGILAAFPPSIYEMVESGADLSKFLMLAGVFIAIVAGMVVVTQARRFLHMEQQRRVKGNQVYGGAQTKLPLMLNQAGVIPVIFASPIMVVLVMGLGTIGLASFVDQAGPGYRYLFAGMIIFFTYFYISITVDLNDWSNNFKQSGFFIRGVKPGRNTAEHIKRILMRITFIGAISLAVITIMPSALGTALGLSGAVAQMVLGGVGLLIVVGVSLDVIQKVGAFLLAHQYQGMMTGASAPGGGKSKASGFGNKKVATKRF